MGESFQNYAQIQHCESQPQNLKANILAVSFQDYCKFGNFHENFIFANSDDIFPIGMSPIHEGFIFTKLGIRKVLR